MCLDKHLTVFHSVLLKTPNLTKPCISASADGYNAMLSVVLSLAATINSHQHNSLAPASASSLMSSATAAAAAAAAETGNR